MSTLLKSIGALLTAMAVVSEAPTGRYDSSTTGGDPYKEPPGAWRGEKSLADEWEELFGRMVEAGYVALERRQGRGIFKANMTAEDFREIVKRQQGRSPRYLSFVLNVPEKDIARWRQQRSLDPETGEPERNGRPEHD